MPKYYNRLTQEIIDYPAEAAALFDVLVPVPSEKADKKTEEELDHKTEKAGTKDAK